jgi:4,5-dihydroxyphthalate decarboxylase
MPDIHLTLAMSEADHMADIMSGRLKPEGISLTCLTLEIEEVFYRFTKYREWDISEMSMGKYVSLVSQNDHLTEQGIIALPVFVSRVFRHASFFVRKDGPVKTPADLKGKRIGIPEWAQTAAVYSRGLIQHEWGIDLASIAWIQAGVNQPGRIEKVALKLPEGINLTPRPDKSLSDMLVSGEIDVAMCARPPACFMERHSNIVRLIPDYVEAESAYFKKTGIFPIMHVVAMKRAVLDKYPWIAMNMMHVFEEAKRRAIERARDATAARYPMPWHWKHAEWVEETFGGDFWPYGLDANRTTLQAFLGYAYEQGVCHRKVELDELFPKQLGSTFKV